MILNTLLGTKQDGSRYYMDLTKLPHLLVAGTTGSGKSVGLHQILVSLIQEYPAKTLRLVLIDPKMTEFYLYNNAPHMLLDTLTEITDISTILAWLSKEMDKRYSLMMEAGTRSFDDYNKGIGVKHLSYILVVIDELADLLLTTDDKTIEKNLVRLAQKARACGIHLILATQRPSSDVLTGLLKSNCPSRLAYRVSTATDSRIILDQQGAQDLNGKGDSLFLASGMSEPIRLQSLYIDDDMIKRSIDMVSIAQVSQKLSIKSLRGDPVKGNTTTKGSKESKRDKWLNRILMVSILAMVWSIGGFIKSIFRLLTVKLAGSKKR